MALCYTIVKRRTRFQSGGARESLRRDCHQSSAGVVMSNARGLRKSVLNIALGLCLTSLAAPGFAQAVTGAVAGRANAGDTITITNDATGQSRTVAVGKD